MVVQVFNYPTENGDFQSEFLFATDKVISYEYTKKWVGTGYFTLVLPLEKKLLGIKANCVLRVGNDWLFVNNVKHNEKQITVSGTDLNGWLDLRITVFGEEQVAGASGYDVVKGTTGECVNHYIQNNMTAPEDGNRKMPRLKIGQTAQGKEKDNYMARLKVLTEVVGNLCANATIGYEVTADIENNCFIFNTLAGTDRSIEQTENSPVIFSQLRNNLFSATYEQGNEDLLNAVYSTGADVTQLVTRDDNVPTGILRREAAIDVSVETVADIKDYTLAQINGNIENNSYELDIRGVEDFGVKYRLGDYITVRDALSGQNWTAQIEQATRIINQSESKIKIVLGDAKTKLLNKIQNSVTINTISESNKVYNNVSDVIKDVSATITGAKGGYVVFHADEDGRLYEILIMDTDDIETATEVWRWNSGGLGYSKTGYNGEYSTAITMDGVIVADFIAAGTLQGVKVICNDGDIGGWKITDSGLVSPDGTIKMISKYVTGENSHGGRIEMYRVSPLGFLDRTCTLEKGGIYLSYNDDERGYFFVDSGNSNQSYLKTDHLNLGNHEISLKTATLPGGTEIKYLGV